METKVSLINPSFKIGSSLMETKFNKKMNKGGYYFSLDAFIALIIIVGIVLVIKPFPTEVIQDVRVQQDLLDVLSNLKIGEIDDSVAISLRSGGYITDLDQSVLEQLGEFYSNSNLTEAESLSNSILTNLNLDKNIGLYFSNSRIASDNISSLEDAKDVWTSRQVIGGVGDPGTGAKGFSSVATLSAENKIKYLYFGGYVGDGNITVFLGENVSSVSVEAVFSGDFDLSVNGNFPISHSPNLNEPYNFIVSAGFVEGDNFLYFTSNENLYIAGGFIRVTYNEPIPSDGVNTYYFPGLEGFINLYDSLYVSGELNSMEVFLHFDSLYDLFLNIGNTTVYLGNGTGTQISLTDTNLSDTFSGNLDYSSMTDKTIPFRLGIDNISYALNASQDADVFSVTDLSGSMDDDLTCNAVSCGFGECCGFFCLRCNEEDEQGQCESCGGSFSGKIISAKEANKVFINAVLNDSDNRVGLIGYRDLFDPNAYHALSKDNVSLINEINTWYADGLTCICCGINEGVDRLNEQSPSNNFRSLVVMTDGQANIECARQGVTRDLNGIGGADDAGDDAVQAACDAYNYYNIRVYAIAFGDDADKNTTEAIASCGAGSAYSGGVDDLVSIYEEIAQEILDAAYYEQTVVGEGFSTKLYPDSYISLDYDKIIPYGLIITAESDEFGVNVPIGNFSLPSDAVPYEANVISYSGSRWTSLVESYNSGSGLWEDVFNLSRYGGEYIELGDPYVVNIPLSKLVQGENSVRVYEGLSSDNITDGSQYNKVIYSVFKNISGFSPILKFASGCTWTIEFEDETTSSIAIPSTYSGVETCSYTSSFISYNPNDAISVAVFRLFLAMDLNSNDKIETKLTESDVGIKYNDIEGIPFSWETEVQVRIWR